MPNWTNNTIIVKGKNQELQKMFNDGVKAEDGKFYLSSWFPIPETYIKYDTTNHPDGKNLVIGNKVGWEENSPVVTEELIEEYIKATKEQKDKYGVVGWYDWNKKNYGVKWDCHFVDCSFRNEEELLMIVDTPWCAPDAWLYKMSIRYPQLEFRVYSHYEDCVNETIYYNNGSCVNETDALYDDILCFLDTYVNKFRDDDKEFKRMKEYAKKYIHFDYYDISFFAAQPRIDEDIVGKAFEEYIEYASEVDYYDCEE